MFQRWDFMGGDFLHLTREFAALAVEAWEHELPEFAPCKEPIVRWVVDNLVKQAAHDFPLLTTDRALLLLSCTGKEHLESVIRPGIDALLAESALRWEHNPYNFRHVPHMPSALDHVNTRGNTAVAILMKLFDVAVGEDVYTTTPEYAYLCEWIDGMRAPNGGYYEAQDVVTGRRYSQGSPAHFIPLWWIFGGL